MKKALSYLGIVIIILGIIVGFKLIFTPEKIDNSEQFSIVNILLGVGSIIYSTFMLLLCEWLSQMLENSKNQTRLLRVIRNNSDEEFEEVEV